MSNAQTLGMLRQIGGKHPAYRIKWKNKNSKTPRHLRFGDDRGEVGYMRDGILTTTNAFSGFYERVREFAGENGDEHEVVIRIGVPVFSGDERIEAST